MDGNVLQLPLGLIPDVLRVGTAAWEDDHWTMKGPDNLSWLGTGHSTMKMGSLCRFGDQYHENLLGSHMVEKLVRSASGKVISMEECSSQMCYKFYVVRSAVIHAYKWLLNLLRTSSEACWIYNCTHEDEFGVSRRYLR